MSKAEADQSPEASDTVELGFDPDALRAKYRRERDKRLRPDGNDQYQAATGDLSKFLEDPYTPAGFRREALSRETDVVLIGGGFGGLQAAARLREQGIKDICIIEKGGDFGGTWYWNRYPGAQCDVESYVYMPLLEELNYLPSKKYASAAEIWEHSKAIGRHYALYEDALFQTEVTEMRWDEDAARWTVSTDRGDRVRARFVAMANGFMHRPKLPGIPGIRDYKGHTFHTSRWDYAYTGGDPERPLARLADKKVAVIGTGATAVQCIPHLAESAEHLHVFQRTPSSIDVRDNRQTDPAWAAGLQAGWQQRRVANFNHLVSGVPQDKDLVNDGWTSLIGKTIARVREALAEDPSGKTVKSAMEIANFQKMNEIRARVDELVDDPRVAEALKPYYGMFCKRPCFHDEYLQTFNRPNVTLVDTDGKGVERITETALVAAGKEYPVDCIVFATGFEMGSGYHRRRAGYEVIGRDGLTLNDKWDAGMRTLHGMQTHGFPNCFVIGISQGGMTVNFPQALNEVGCHLAHIIGHAMGSGYTTVEATAEAEEAWAKTILESINVMSLPGGGGDCTPSYYNSEGKPDPKSLQSAPYRGPTGGAKFWRILEKWRQAGTFDGLEFS